MAGYCGGESEDLVSSWAVTRYHPRMLGGRGVAVVRAMS